MNRAEYDRQYRAKRQAQGLCRDCSAPCISGSLVCEKHRQRRQQASKHYNAVHKAKLITKSKMRYRQRLRAGLCVICGEVARPERATCEIHGKQAAENTKKKTAQQRTKGLCASIGCPSRPSSGHTLCEFHLQDMRERAQVRMTSQIRKGLCVNSCRRKVEFPPLRRCLTCEATRRERLGIPGLPASVEKRVRKGFAIYRWIESQRFLLRYLNLVSPKEQAVLRIVYDLGFLGGKKQSLTVAAKQMGFCRERARQIHDKAMLRILAVPEETPIALRPLKARLEKYPLWLNQRLRARQLAEKAISSGKIPKQPCKECGALKAQAHHPDYSKPLEVEWLCRPCHDKEHHGEKAA